MTRAAALAAIGAGQAFRRRRKDRDGESQGIGRDSIRGLRGRGSRLRGARRVKSSEVDQCICSLWWVTREED